MSQPATLSIGDVLAGKYVVERVLGAGGMGTVVAARHTDLGELRAVKMMLPKAAENEEHVERFLREARAAVRLKSEHVVRVHDMGRLDSGAPFLVMEHLEGTDLARELQRRGAVPVEEAVAWLLQAIEAVAEAHAAGIIHRDLKPSNLFLTTAVDGAPSVKVLDFGISKIVDPTKLDMTKTSAVLGSPLYMSPEQMRSARGVDARTDVWALGVILYELTTGTVPFSAESITELTAMVLQDAHVKPSQRRPELPAALDDIVDGCLAKDPDHRYADVAALAVDLVELAPPDARGTGDRILRMAASSSKRAPWSSRPPRPPSRGEAPAEPALAAGAVVGRTTAGQSMATAATSRRQPWPWIGVGLAALAVGAFALTRGSQEPRSTTAAGTSTSPAAELPVDAPSASVTAAPMASAAPAQAASPGPTTPSARPSQPRLARTAAPRPTSSVWQPPVMER